MGEAKLVCWCDRCGTELYAGECCYRLEGQCVCADCLLSYARERFQTALEFVQ